MEGATNNIMDKWTDTDENWSVISPVLLSAYSGFQFKKYTALSGILFGKLTTNLMRGTKGYQKSIYEKNRIFTDVSIEIDDILDAQNAGKYEDGALYEKGKSRLTDRKNMQDNLKYLHDNNIYYMWLYRGNYMFFMEREVRCWKCYNDNGVVIPKTLRKIIIPSSEELNRMARHQNMKGKKVDRGHMEHHFGCFFEGMIRKMNPLVGSSFPALISSKTFYDYKCRLEDHLTNVGDMDGLNLAKNFFVKLPPDMVKNIEAKVKKEEAEKKKEQQTMNAKKTEMEKELTDENPNVCSNKGVRKERQKKEKVQKSMTNESEVDSFAYSDDYIANPFEDSKIFAQYYKNYMSLHSGKPLRYECIGVMSEHAGYILDDLIEMHKKGDKEFIDSWFKNYLGKLTTHQKQNVERTSLKALRKTLEDFSKIYSAS